LIESRKKGLALRSGEELQLVNFLVEVGRGNIKPDMRLAISPIQLEDGSTEDRLGPENLFDVVSGVSLDLAAADDEELRVIQSALQTDLMPAVCGPEWQQRFAATFRS
jgi:hypothetical protein